MRVRALTRCFPSPSHRMQIACDVSIPAAFHGVEGSAVYIDTEGSFVPERVAEIAQGLVDHLNGVAAPVRGAAAD